MRGGAELARELRRIDGRGYKAYQDIRGSYRLDRCVLHVDHVQGDPFAAPSRLCVELDREAAGLGRDLDGDDAARLALEDYLGRSFARGIRRVVGRRRQRRGMGKSGLIEIDAGGQEILERSAVVAWDRVIEIRFVAGLPARGRTVLGRQAEEMLLDEIPEMVQCSLLADALDQRALARHVETVVDWTTLRDQLEPRGLVAFVADGSVLPRRSGVDPRPLEGEHVVPFESPPELAVDLELGGGRSLRGMGIGAGVTLIVGGGFHGKSTLLDALALGIYPHVPGDGRERVVARSSVVKVRAEDGRRVAAVDISPFIANLPHRRNVRRFESDNASGSTSQAANIVEALEMGADALLIDEDTSATNFMVRDRRMQQLVTKDHEPITPFIDRVRELSTVHDCSTVLVVGGCGDYFDVADRVVQLDEYRAADVTAAAKEIARQHPDQRIAEVTAPLVPLAKRCPEPQSFDASKGKRDVKIGAKGLREIHFGETVLELGALEQMVDPSQTRAIGELIYLYATEYLRPGAGLRAGIERMMADVALEGLDIAAPHRRGNLAMVRSFEVAAAINRMRTLRIGDGSNPRAPRPTPRGSRV
ncbi:MAG: ABC-ATPase domain-containing protein [Deltaproteobacteria bacterium]|jgi:predicted ABC-class ATPase|nr:ABC-ATPase domain-containing protein [Deltaproteobacteria bacterium]MBW2529994.1 ABC-ATPase domain-containing protein [Deltaproteobacteria bacterium]